MSDSSPNTDSKWDDEIIQGHDYDGIQEYDNPMPAWWLWIWYATIAWSLFYIAALGIGWIDDYDAQLESGKDRIAQKQAAHAAAMADSDAPVVDEESLTALLDDDDALATGSDVYAARCAQCHGRDGGGGIGPAFNDDQWDHGEELMVQYEIIRDGIAAEGMPAHNTLLSDDEMGAVTAFINTF